MKEKLSEEEWRNSWTSNYKTYRNQIWRIFPSFSYSVLNKVQSHDNLRFIDRCFSSNHFRCKLFPCFFQLLCLLSLCLLRLILCSPLPPPTHLLDFSLPVQTPFLAFFLPSPTPSWLSPTPFLVFFLPSPTSLLAFSMPTTTSFSAFALPHPARLLAVASSHHVVWLAQRFLLMAIIYWRL